MARGGQAVALLDQRRPGGLIEPAADQLKPIRPGEALRGGGDAGQKLGQFLGRNRFALAFQPGGQMADSVVGRTHAESLDSAAV